VAGAGLPAKSPVDSETIKKRVARKRGEGAISINRPQGTGFEGIRGLKREIGNASVGRDTPDLVKIFSTALMLLSGLFCSLTCYFHEDSDPACFVAGSFLFTPICLVWGLILFCLRKDPCLALGCVLVAASELFVLFVIVAVEVA
jgi:hypothetical protein